MSTTGPTETSQPGSGEPPALRGRRALARAVDGLLAGLISALVVWPFVWGAVTDALAVGGFGSARDVVVGWLDGAAPAGDLSAVREELAPVVLSTVLLQVLVVWLYEALTTAVAGTTPGKALSRLRVVARPTGSDFTIGPTAARVRRPWWDRPLRMMLRAALAVGPPALAVGTLVAGALGVPGGTEIAEITLALTIVLVVVWVASGSGVHGSATGTDVVSFSWQEAKNTAQQRVEREGQAATESARRRINASTGTARQRLGSTTDTARERLGSTTDSTEGRLSASAATARRRAEATTGAARERVRTSTETATDRVQGQAPSLWDELEQTPLGPVVRAVREALGHRSRER